MDEWKQPEVGAFFGYDTPIIKPDFKSLQGPPLGIHL